jgi:hypothetical protein
LECLPQNLVVTWPYRARVTWYIVDFNAPEDFEIQQFLAESCRIPWLMGHIKYFRCPITGWHASICKNTSHMVAQEDSKQRVLVNVDGDNLITIAWVDSVVSEAPDLCAGKLTCVRWQGADGGVTGRVAMSQAMFNTLNGYDEDLLPSGYQDVDIYLRAVSLGPGKKISGTDVAGRSIPNLPRHVLVASRHHAQMYAAKVVNVDNAYQDITWTAMNEQSRTKAKEKMKRAGVLKYWRNEERGLGHRPVTRVMMHMPPGRCVFNLDLPREERAPIAWARGSVSV